MIGVLKMSWVDEIPEVNYRGVGIIFSDLRDEDEDEFLVFSTKSFLKKLSFFEL